MPTVVAARGERGAWAQASAEVVSQAAGRAQDRKQFPLVGELHRLPLRAIAKLEQVVDAPDGVAHAHGAFEWAEERQLFAGRLAREERVRRRLPANGDVDVALEAGNADHVVARLPAANQLEFPDQGVEFTRRLFPNDGASAGDDPAGFFIATPAAKIAQQSIAQQFRL